MIVTIRHQTGASGSSLMLHLTAAPALTPPKEDLYYAAEHLVEAEQLTPGWCVRQRLR